MLSALVDRNRLLRGGARLFQPLLSKIEPRLLSVDSDLSKFSPVFIVGAPRTGSTVLYQMLTHTLECLYINNLVQGFSYNLPFGFWLSHKLLGDGSHDSFDSSFGNTETLRSPSECGTFWFRWFPRNLDFVQSSDLSQQAKDEIRRNVHSVMNRYGKAMIFKNLNAGQRLRVLRDIFPNAKYVFIRRDPFFTIQSLMQARQKLGILPDRWWSVRPENFRELSELGYSEKIAGQVYYLEKQIVEDLAGFPFENVFEVCYSKYAEQFDGLLRFLDMPVRQTIDLQAFSFDNNVTLDSTASQKLRTEMEKYDWNALGYE